MVIDVNQTALKYRVNLALIEIAEETKMEENWLDGNIDSVNFWIKKEVLPYPIQKDVYELLFKAYNKEDRLILERRELILFDF